jgi:hypothetical protein
MEINKEKFNKKVETKKEKVNVFGNIKNGIRKYRRIIFVIIIFLILLTVFNVISDYNYNKKYKSYEDKFNSYGFNKLYNNLSAKSSEYVQRSEAIKVILGSIFNKNDITSFAYQTDEKYDNAIWVKYAENEKMITAEDINSSNYNKNISLIDTIVYYSNARNKILNQTYKSESKATYKDIDRYTNNQIIVINDFFENKIIDNSDNNLNGNGNLRKGELNKLVVNFVEKYNTITLEGQKINVNPEKEPSNKSEYPFTLSDIDKEVYEKSFYTSNSKQFENPITVYTDIKNYYEQIKIYMEQYYNTLLNIDYNTIEEGNLITSLSKYSLYTVQQLEVQRYIKYVKENKIKITGTATFQSPIVYYDGSMYRIRMKLEFNVDSADKYENLLYLDSNSETPIKYTEGKNVIYIDAPSTSTIGSKTLFPIERPIYSIKSGEMK